MALECNSPSFFNAIKCSQWTEKQAAEKLLTRPLLAHLLLHNTQVETFFAGHTWCDWKLMCMVYKAISCSRTSVNWPKITVLIFVSFFTRTWIGFAEVFQSIGREMSNWNVYSHDLYASTCWRDPSHKQQIICNYYIDIVKKIPTTLQTLVWK